MFTEYINRILESERDFGSNRQEEVTTPDVIEKSSIIDNTYSGAYPFTFRQPIKHKIAFKSTILYPFIP